MEYICFVDFVVNYLYVWKININLDFDLLDEELFDLVIVINNFFKIIKLKNKFINMIICLRLVIIRFY